MTTIITHQFNKIVSTARGGHEKNERKEKEEEEEEKNIITTVPIARRMNRKGMQNKKTATLLR